MVQNKRRGLNKNLNARADQMKADVGRMHMLLGSVRHELSLCISSCYGWDKDGISLARVLVLTDRRRLPHREILVAHQPFRIILIDSEALKKITSTN